MSLTVTCAYRFALDPTPRQIGALARHCGAARVAFNWGLARIKANLAQREAERCGGIGENELTPSVGWSMYSMRKARISPNPASEITRARRRLRTIPATLRSSTTTPAYSRASPVVSL
jgi:hypothetical protein